MLQHQVTIRNKLGLHARAAAKFVSCATTFSSRVMVGVTVGVTVEEQGALVDGKSIMSVMMLAAGRGASLQLQTEGEDEQEALDALVALIDRGFDESN